MRADAVLSTPRITKAGVKTILGGHHINVTQGLVRLVFYISNEEFCRFEFPVVIHATKVVSFRTPALIVNVQLIVVIYHPRDVQVSLFMPKLFVHQLAACLFEFRI